MRSGKLRHLVSVQQLLAGSPQQLASGEPDATWTDVVTNVHAAIEPLRGRELLAAQQINAEVSGTVRMRYRAGVTSAMRIKWGTRYYDILAVVDFEERHVELLLYVRERVNQG